MSDKKKISIINGPNLNLLGKREKNIYGNLSFEEYFEELKTYFANLELKYFQSNSEGEIITHIHSDAKDCIGIVLNAASFSHSSIGICDAIAAIKIPVVEVHISNIYSRETFRHNSITAQHCAGVISGFKMFGYKMALEYLVSL